jgi:hypothetical protein
MLRSPKCMMCHKQHLKISIETEQQQWPYRFQWAKHLLCSQVVEVDLKHSFVFMKQCVSEFTTMPVHELCKLPKKCVFSYSLTVMRSVMKRLASCSVHNKNMNSLQTLDSSSLTGDCSWIHHHWQETVVSLNKCGNILAYFRDEYSKHQFPPRRIFIAVEKGVTVLYYSCLKIMVTESKKWVKAVYPASEKVSQLFVIMVLSLHMHSIHIFKINWNLSWEMVFLCCLSSFVILPDGFGLQHSRNILKSSSFVWFQV